MLIFKLCGKWFDRCLEYPHEGWGFTALISTMLAAAGVFTILVRIGIEYLIIGWPMLAGVVAIGFYYGTSAIWKVARSG